MFRWHGASKARRIVRLVWWSSGDFHSCRSIDAETPQGDTDEPTCKFSLTLVEQNLKAYRLDTVVFESTVLPSLRRVSPNTRGVGTARGFLRGGISDRE